MKLNLKSFIEDRCVKITETGCWIWMNALSGTTGYGSFRDEFNGPTKAAHRASYEAFKGPIPEGLWVLHTCDIRCCCNPAHLWLGTRQENIEDASHKGRLNVTRKRPSGLKYVIMNKPGTKKRQACR